PIVAIYPKEGTFWSDHPVGIVERPWVTAEHREAASMYIQFLLDRPQQQKALTYGFRPASVDVPAGAPLNAQHGVDPAEPRTTLEVPPTDVIGRVLEVWRANKKSADVVLVLDTSGSMNEEQKLIQARIGAKQFIALMNEADSLSLLPFSTQSNWA